MSASSCRRVHSEILESVSKIKCSLLGRKGGLLHSYGNYGSDIALSEIVGNSGRNHISPHNNKAALSHETSPRKSLETPKTVRKIKSQNAITVSLPSPAGNRRSSRQGSISSNNGGGTKSSKEGKSWDKMKKVRKTVKQFSTDKGKDPKD